MTTTRRILIGAALVASLADLVSTEIALNRPGTYEGNPLLRERGVRIGLGVGTCVAVSEIDHSLRKHRKSQWAVRIIAGGLLAFAVQNNVRAGTR